jgi:hypothetical protein
VTLTCGVPLSSTSRPPCPSRCARPFGARSPGADGAKDASRAKGTSARGRPGEQIAEELLRTAQRLERLDPKG